MQGYGTWDGARLAAEEFAETKRQEWRAFQELKRKRDAEGRSSMGGSPARKRAKKAVGGETSEHRFRKRRNNEGNESGPSPARKRRRRKAGRRQVDAEHCSPPPSGTDGKRQVDAEQGSSPPRKTRKPSKAGQGNGDWSELLTGTGASLGKPGASRNQSRHLSVRNEQKLPGSKGKPKGTKRAGQNETETVTKKSKTKRNAVKAAEREERQLETEVSRGRAKGDAGKHGKTLKQQRKETASTTTGQSSSGSTGRTGKPKETVKQKVGGCRPRGRPPR